ncbi:MAG: PQQ-binding-like beta-propeller repeat protein [Gemmataceae bacterium]
MSETINAICPECLSRYRLKADMVGKRMRCTNSDCQAAFEVMAEADPGLVGAVRLPEETESWPAAGYGLKPQDATPAEPNAEFNWQDAPPPVQVIVDEPAEKQVLGQSWEDAAIPRPPAPVSKREAASIAKPTDVPLFAEPVRKRSYRGIMVALLAFFVIGGIATGVILLVQEMGRAEEKLAAEAGQYYTAGQYGKASETYEELARRYSHSLHAAEYRFLAALSTVRLKAGLVPAEPEPALTELSKFLDEFGTSTFLTNRRDDVYVAALKVLNDLVYEGAARLHAKPPDLNAADSYLALAHTALKILNRNAPNSADVASAKAKVDGLANAITLARARTAARKEILALLSSPEPDLDTARDLIRRAGFENDPEISTAWQKAEEALRKLVVYRKLEIAAKPAAPAHARVIYPDVRPAAGGSGPRVPALARGILWALDSRNGRVGWVDRLGIDATIPPLVSPAVGNHPEEWLVIAADPPSLSLRDANTGAVKWYQPLDELPVGPAVLSGRRGFLALGGAKGRVLDFDANTGMVAGMFETGQPFAGGLALRPGTNLLYVPASSQQVYVLDTAPEDGGTPRCLTTLATGHTPGTLRTPPEIVGEITNQNLALALTDGLGETRLAIYRLDASSGSPVLSMIAHLPGWTWYAPQHDSERIAVITDRGALGWFAFRQVGAADPPLYPLEDRDSGPPLSDHPPERGLVVHTDESGVVVLANGRLTQWRTGIDRVKGRRLVPGWSLEQELGTPLHEAFRAEAGVAVLSTLQDETSGAMTTAVDVATGNIVWQRPLGLAPKNQFLQVGNSVAVIDERGAMTLFDAASRGEDGRLAGKAIAAVGPGLTGPPAVVRSTEGADWIVLPQANAVLLRSIGADGSVTERRLVLPANLLGTPAIGNGTAVLPLANGLLARAQLNDAGRVDVGPSWRAPGGGSDATGLVVFINDNTYAVSDGGRRLMKLNWNSPQDFSLNASEALELPARPTRIVRDARGSYLAAADANGSVTLIDAQRLTAAGKFGQAGKMITAGPVFNGDQIAFVSDGRELQVIPASQPTRRWQFTTPGEAIVGLPMHLGEQDYVMADQGGQLILVRSANGKTAHKAFPLAGGSPVGGPFAFGNDWLLPLVDGTAEIMTKRDLPH